MLPRRPTLAKGNTVTPLDVEQVDVTRYEIMFDTGQGLSFDLETADTLTETEDGRIIVKLGERVIRVRPARILYTETRPAKMNKVRPSGSI